MLNSYTYVELMKYLDVKTGINYRCTSKFMCKLADNHIRKIAEIDSNILEKLIYNNNIHALKYLTKNDMIKINMNDIFILACQLKYLDIAKYIYSHYIIDIHQII